VPRVLSTAKRGVAALMLSLGVLALTASAAFAHECVNESRSAQGDANAAAGNGWTLTSDVVFMFILPDMTGETLSAEELAEAQALVAAEKASGDFDAIYAEDRAILDHATAMNGNTRGGHTAKSSDNHAIDHVTADFAEVGPLLDRLTGIFFAVQS
jgi:methionine-rich copper-binding protein CopC